MAKEKSPIEKAFAYLKRTFPKDIDHAMPALFIMWLIGDFVNLYGFNHQQLYEIANAIIEVYFVYDGGGLSNVIDKTLDLLYDIEVPVNTAADDVFDMFMDFLVTGIPEIIQYIDEETFRGMFPEEE